MHLRKPTLSAPALLPLLRLLPALALVLAGPAAAAGWPQLTQLAHSGARVSAAALDLGSGRLIAELHAGERVTPASLTKLAVAAAALERWPVDRVFRTTLMTTAPATTGRLDGDLILQGDGDPSLDDQSLWGLAARLRGAGVLQVTGRLIVHPAPFALVGCETRDRCDALQRSDRSYNAPLGAVGVDFGNWCVLVQPAVAGSPALVRGCGVTRLPIEVEGDVHTVGARGRSTFWVERVTQDGVDRLRVGGDVPEGEPQQLYRAMSDPVLGAGLLLKEMLRELGVNVAGGVVTTNNPPLPSAYALAQTSGLALSEQLGRMLRYSNNYIADVLTLDLAAEHAPQPPDRLAQAASVLSAFVATLPRTRGEGGAHAAAAQTGIGATIVGNGPAGSATTVDPPPLYSGSGLTPENLLSADELVALLARQYRDPRHFPAFYGLLVVPRDAPFAFLRQGSEDWLDRVALKTGSMDDPHSVLGIAGYLRRRDGGFIAFTAIVNGGGQRPRIPLNEALAAARSDVEGLLRQY